MKSAVTKHQKSLRQVVKVSAELIGLHLSKC